MDRPEEQTPLILGTHDACTMLGGISRTKLWELEKAGEVVKVKIGKRAFYTAESLAAYVDRLIAHRGERKNGSTTAALAERAGAAA